MSKTLIRTYGMAALMSILMAGCEISEPRTDSEVLDQATEVGMKAYIPKATYFKTRPYSVSDLSGAEKCLIADNTVLQFDKTPVVARMQGEYNFVVLADDGTTPISSTPMKAKLSMFHFILPALV